MDKILMFTIAGTSSDVSLLFYSNGEYERRSADTDKLFGISYWQFDEDNEFYYRHSTHDMWSKIRKDDRDEIYSRFFDAYHSYMLEKELF